MNRINEEKNYWNSAAKDPDVDKKYICDLDTQACHSALGELPGKVLEIGCGVGRMMQPDFYGIDISEEMIKIAKNRKPQCHFKVSNGREIPYDEETFDTVYCILVFQHLPIDAVENYFREAYRVLNPGGVFKFQLILGTEDEPFSHHHSPEKVLTLLRDIGFEVKIVKTGEVHQQWTWFEAEKPDFEPFIDSL